MYIHVTCNQKNENEEIKTSNTAVRCLHASL